MANGQPDTKQHKPDNIADSAKGTCTNVVRFVQIATVDGVLTKGPECQFPHHKAGAAKWNTDNTDKTNQPNQTPGQPHHKAA